MCAPDYDTVERGARSRQGVVAAGHIIILMRGAKMESAVGNVGAGLPCFIWRRFRFVDIAESLAIIDITCRLRNSRAEEEANDRIRAMRDFVL